MAIIRWNPWNLSRILEDELQLPTSFSNFGIGQGLDLYETDQSIVAEASIPGIPEDKIDVTVGKDRVVRISGQVEEKESDKEGVHTWMSTRSRSVNYAFQLPENITTDKEPVCELENGVLRIEFEKVQPEPPKKIAVKSKKSSDKKE